MKIYMVSLFHRATIKSYGCRCITRQCIHVYIYTISVTSYDMPTHWETDVQFRSMSLTLILTVTLNLNLTLGIILTITLILLTVLNLIETLKWRYDDKTHLSLTNKFEIRSERCQVSAYICGSTKQGCLQGMHVYMYTCVHNKLLCIRLRNYVIVFTNMVVIHLTILAVGFCNIFGNENMWYDLRHTWVTKVTYGYV